MQAYVTHTILDACYTEQPFVFLRTDLEGKENSFANPRVLLKNVKPLFLIFTAVIFF
jgi:hypothetical protein